jgi:membrane-bound lytic murein transglycosylase D
MHALRTSLVWSGSWLLAAGLGYAQGQTYRLALLSPPGPAARAFLVPEPPPLDASAQPSDSPRFVSPLPPSSLGSRADILIREADWYFQAGRAHYQAGDVGAARTEFDRAIDTLLAAPEEAAIRIPVDKKLEELVEAIHRLDLAGLGAGETGPLPGFERPPLEDVEPLTFPVDPALKDKVAEELRATSSQLPLQITDAVLSYIDFFSKGHGRRILVYGLQRSGRYRTLIHRILDEEGVPQELIYLAQAESGFQPRAVSRKRATGMWQFMASRGQEYGLERSGYSDDRLDPEKATRAAARHLRDLYHHFGDWYLAMAAYNCGPVNVDRAVERTGYADFWELRARNVLPKETANYVPAILAMTIIMKNPKEYGLDGIDGDPALENDTIQVSAPTHLQLVADLTECPVSQLHDLNPALLKNVAPAGTTLRIPKGSGLGLAEAIDAVPPEKRTAWRVHRIAGGDTLPAVAQRYRVTPKAILAANRTVAGPLEEGDLLVIPTAPVPEKVVAHRTAHRRAAPAHSTSASARSHRPAKHAPAPAYSAARSHSHSATYTTAALHSRGPAKPAAGKQ